MLGGLGWCGWAGFFLCLEPGVECFGGRACGEGVAGEGASKGFGSQPGSTPSKRSSPKMQRMMVRTTRERILMIEERKSVSQKQHKRGKEKQAFTSSPLHREVEEVVMQK